MMPLSMVNEGEPQVIKKVGGKEETRKFLENLGFVQGATVTVVSEISGNMIVNVKDSRALKVLSGMVDEGILKKKGKLKGSYYIINKNR